MTWVQHSPAPLTGDQVAAEQWQGARPGLWGWSLWPVSSLGGEGRVRGVGQGSWGTSWRRQEAEAREGPHGLVSSPPHDPWLWTAPLHSPAPWWESTDI